MRISEVKVKNFRTLKDLAISFEPTTVIVGENNAGKTALFELLEKVLSPASRGIPLSEDDFHHDVDPSQDAIDVVIELRPDTAAEFTEVEKRLFYPHVDIDEAGNERLLVHMAAKYEADFEGVRPVARFMKIDGSDDQGSFLALRRHVPFFMVSSVRDARRELVTAQGLWSRLAKTGTFDEAKVAEISSIGQEAGRKVLETALGDVGFRKLVDDLTSLLSTVLWPTAQQGKFG